MDLKMYSIYLFPQPRLGKEHDEHESFGPNSICHRCTFFPVVCLGDFTKNALYPAPLRCQAAVGNRCWPLGPVGTRQII